MAAKKQTLVFSQPPLILASAAVGGEREKESPLAGDFDYFFKNNRADCQSFEEAETAFLNKACDLALKGASLSPGDIDLFLAGDLINQITPSSFSARQYYIPYIGVYSACATCVAGLALASIILESGMMEYILTGASSNIHSAERQFRYPNEYGCQKPDTCQITASAAGVAIIGAKGDGIAVKAVTLGKVVDWGISDPLNMGAAMAPAAAATIAAHFEGTGLKPDDYDLIISGDLGRTGHLILKDLLLEEGILIPEEKLKDCGMLLYPPGGKNFAGGSGAGCAASVLYGHILKKIKKGEYKNVFLIATGALLSPNSCKQNESIPAIAHGVSLEGGLN